ncbi:MAG: phytanoyl-CoA dioxygenase family protein [Armatimonadetes bacterium]|nr:phytanoyl-CoA dioxygenase family protein [Armatimonadota bacterium]
MNAEILLTPAQRYHLDALGYLLLKGVLTPDEVKSIKAALYRLKEEPDLAKHRVYTHKHGDHHQLFGHLVEYDPALLAYAVHPKLVPLVEELVGGAVRLEESEAIINRRNPEADVALLRQRHSTPTGFHTGTRHGWGTYFEQERFHCIFVKTLAYLTDVGAEDGGTAVIPGSHKMSWRQQEMIDAALSDPSLIHQVVAQAGDVLLFSESLIHSTTEILSDKERAIIVSGYTPPMLREWMGNEISPEFLESQPEPIRKLLSGSDSWNWRRNHPI